MDEVRVATYFISKDEPAWSLTEVNRVSPHGDGSAGPRRFQIVAVMRGQAVAEYTVDLGRAENFKAEGFCIVGGWQHPDTGRIEIVETVGRLQDMAVQLRERSVTEYARETLPLRDIVGDFRNTMEHMTKARKHQRYTQFGYGGN